jgi:hypothetical protein
VTKPDVTEPGATEPDATEPAATEIDATMASIRAAIALSQRADRLAAPERLDADRLSPPTS